MHRPTLNCRDEILEGLHDFMAARPTGEFYVEELVIWMCRRGTLYSRVTVRRYVMELMCANSTSDVGAKYQDFERVSRGRYRLRNHAAQDVKTS